MVPPMVLASRINFAGSPVQDHTDPLALAVARRIRRRIDPLLQGRAHANRERNVQPLRISRHMTTLYGAGSQLAQPQNNLSHTPLQAQAQAC